jgi:hypothetical protein
MESQAVGGRFTRGNDYLNDRKLDEHQTVDLLLILFFLRYFIILFYISF